MADVPVLYSSSSYSTYIFIYLVLPRANGNSEETTLAN